jgi:hypothetical protein
MRQEIPTLIILYIVTECSWYLAIRAISTLPFKEMWIMDVGFNATSAPTESCMTLSTPHLVTIPNHREIAQQEAMIGICFPTVVSSFFYMMYINRRC